MLLVRIQSQVPTRDRMMNNMLPEFSEKELEVLKLRRKQWVGFHQSAEEKTQIKLGKKKEKACTHLIAAVEAIFPYHQNFRGFPLELQEDIDIEGWRVRALLDIFDVKVE